MSHTSPRRRHCCPAAVRSMWSVCERVHKGAGGSWGGSDRQCDNLTGSEHIPEVLMQCPPADTSHSCAAGALAACPGRADCLLTPTEALHVRGGEHSSRAQGLSAPPSPASSLSRALQTNGWRPRCSGGRVGRSGGQPWAGLAPQLLECVQRPDQFQTHIQDTERVSSAKQTRTYGRQRAGLPKLKGRIAAALPGEMTAVSRTTTRQQKGSAVWLTGELREQLVQSLPHAPLAVPPQSCQQEAGVLTSAPLTEQEAACPCVSSFWCTRENIRRAGEAGAVHVAEGRVCLPYCTLQASACAATRRSCRSRWPSFRPLLARLSRRLRLLVCQQRLQQLAALRRQRRRKLAAWLPLPQPHDRPCQPGAIRKGYQACSGQANPQPCCAVWPCRRRCC